MDAIKKKMQAMKVEKDNAMDRADVCEQAAKDAKVGTRKEIRKFSSWWLLSFLVVARQILVFQRRKSVFKMVFLYTDAGFKGRGGGGRAGDQGSEAGGGVGQVQGAAYHKVFGFQLVCFFFFRKYQSVWALI